MLSKKKSSKKRDLLSEERTILAEERTLTANIRTVLAFIALLIVIVKLVWTAPWWPVVIALFLLSLVILAEDFYKLVKTRRKEKNLRNETGV
ncbi:MAG: DUF202 domain-containing protein [Nanoarchaeota archaeon]|nr:DUF202 domain-containing protein [Nanoarchaeota archaeon]